MTVDAATRESVIEWIKRHAHPLTTNPDAPLTDLDLLRELLRDATVIGLGRSAHGSHELTVLTHRILRFVVEHMGFRSLAVEEDWTKGIQVDEYLRTGIGDPRALLDDAATHWRTEEFHDVIRWMRSYNERHPADRLRFVGVDINGARELAYDAVTDYVRRAAPKRLHELDAHYAALRPAPPIAEHIERVRQQAGKQSLIDHARRAFDLVAALPPDDDHALALQHARVIVGFYEFHAIDNVGVVEPRLAENTIWWHEQTGQKIVYWGGCPHTVVGETRTVSFPPAPPKTDRNAGSYLREHFGPAYVSVGLTFDHGSVAQASVAVAVPPPSPGSADAVLGSAGLDAHLVDLRHEQAHAVRAWLHAPTTLRLIGPRYDPEHDAAHHMSGGSLGEWFDMLGHCQKTTPTRPLQ